MISDEKCTVSYHMLKTIPFKVKYDTDISNFVNKHPNRFSKLLLLSNALVDHMNVLFIKLPVS